MAGLTEGAGGTHTLSAYIVIVSVLPWDSWSVLSDKLDELTVGEKRNASSPKEYGEVNIKANTKIESNTPIFRSSPPYQ